MSNRFFTLDYSSAGSPEKANFQKRLRRLENGETGYFPDIPLISAYKGNRKGVNSMPRKHAEVVDLLKEILSKYFGGKEGGRYRIGKERFLKLMDRATLRDSEFELLSDECLEAGLVITDIGSQYAIQELSVLRNYRSVPQGIVERVLVATGNEETQD